MKYSSRMAYIFLIPSLFGVAGLQRFYLGKVGSGILYLLTGGLFGIGTIYDLITLPDQVREANLRERYRSAIDFDDEALLEYRSRREAPRTNTESIEYIILRTAKKNNGIATPSEVALEGRITTDEAKRYLEQLASKGYADVRVTKSGLVVYVFPEFISDEEEENLEDY